MKKILGILLLCGAIMVTSCKKDKDEPEKEVPAKPGKFTLDGKSHDFERGYYYLVEDEDMGDAYYQITLTNKNIFGF